MANNAVQQIQVTRVTDGISEELSDAIAIEEPLDPFRARPGRGAQSAEYFGHHAHAR